jgi:RNase P subunit RPR2
MTLVVYDFSDFHARFVGDGIAGCFLGEFRHVMCGARRRAMSFLRGTLTALRLEQRADLTPEFLHSRNEMKPAIETPGGVSTDPYSKTVCCLRCEQKLQRYQLMRASLAPGAGHAILSCPRCGHIEFVVDSSPLLQNLELIAVDTGDGD